MRIYEKNIGEILESTITSYSLMNNNGFEVRVLNLGGIITDIITCDKNGNKENVVLKYKDFESYINNPSYLGALIGRTSGRISNGEVELNGELIKFNKNYNLHQGHGGNEGFNKKIYNVIKGETEKEVFVELSRISEDGEENYPGNLEVKVRYTVTDNNELKISYYGVSDKDTLVNLTNHSYFNLSGNGKADILNHELYINSNSIVELNNVQAPTGELLNIEETEFDFTNAKKIGKDINGDHIQLKYGNGYDIPWYLNDNSNLSLSLYDDKSGRLLEVYTDRKTVVVYTHNYPDQETLENNNNGMWRYGVAVEPQNPPIGLNYAFVEDSILKSGEEYKSETVYKFSTR